VRRGTKPRAAAAAVGIGGGVVCGLDPDFFYFNPANSLYSNNGSNFQELFCMQPLGITVFIHKKKESPYLFGH